MNSPDEINGLILNIPENYCPIQNLECRWYY